MTSDWTVVGKFTPVGSRLADDHYSRRTVGSPQFMPPGQTLVLVTDDELAVFGWWRPDPRSGIVAMNGLDGWTCTIFRNTGPRQSSALILAAELALVERHDVGPDGFLTYVWDAKVASANPGYCFQAAGWVAVGRSADGRKTLLWKDPERAGAVTVTTHDGRLTRSERRFVREMWRARRDSNSRPLGPQPSGRLREGR